MRQKQLLIFTVLIALLFPLGSWAKLNSGDEAATAKAKVMVVTTMDGRKTKLGLKNTPIITIETPYLVYKSDVAEARFELDQLRDIKYEDVTPILGDASGDGVINRADVDETVQYIFGKPSGDFIFSNANTNHDQKVNAADIVQISDLVKNPNINDISKSRSAANSDDQATYSQQHQYAIYNYRNDNDFNAFLNVDIDKIIYSNIGLDGTEYKNAVVQEVWTPDSVYRIPIQAIDSIGFRAPEPIMREGVFHITEDHIPYTRRVEELTITFSSNIPSSMLPKMGQVVVCDIYDEPYEDGFAGRVVNIVKNEESTRVECEEIGLDDVYDQIIYVGKTILYEDNEDNPVKNKTRLSLDWDGTIEIPLGKFSIKVGDDSDASVNLSAKPSINIDYLVAYNVKGVDDQFKIVARPKLEFGLDYKIKIKKKKEYEDYLGFIPVETGLPGLRCKIRFGAFLKVEGSISLNGSLKYVTETSAGFDSSLDENYGFFYSVDSGWEEPEVTLSLEGSLFCGPAMQIFCYILYEKGFPSVKFNLRPGYELSGKLEISSDAITEYGFSMYDMLKDSKLSFAGKLNADASASVFGKKFDLLSYTLSPDWLKEEAYLFPTFTKPELCDLKSDFTPTALVSEVSRRTLFTTSVGMGVYDEFGRRLNEDAALYPYQNKAIPTKTCVEHDMKNYTVGTYNVRPIVKNIFGTFEASPVATFKVPSPVSFENSTITVQKNNSKVVALHDGWGSYEIINGDVEVAKASFFPDSFTPGGGAGGGGGTSWPNDSFAGNGAGGGGGSSWFNGDSSSSSTENKPQIYIEGIGVGKTTIQVKDMRSNETASILVVVTDEEITPLELSSTLLTLEEGKEGTVTVSSGSGKYTAESSKSDVATVKVSKGKIQVTAIKAGSTTITVTDMETNQTAIIEVSVTEAEPETPYIPVQTETIVVKGVPFTMVAVEGGSFMMGSPDDDPDAGGIYSDEKPQHRVILSNFAIGQTEVTQALWKVVMGDNPSTNIGYKKPVEQVGWDLCQTFISKLNALTGRTFRMPTEAEWEYAARGGKNSKGYKYAGSNDIDEVAWNINNSEETTHIVGTKNSNELGLYDMSGNVWEWCQDWYDWTYYSNSPEINPCNTTEVTSNDEADHQHIHRGGSISYIIKDLRNAMRGDFRNDPNLYLKGLRLVVSDGKTGYNKTTAEDEAYAAYDNGILSFYCDGDRFSKGGETYDMPDYESSPDWHRNSSDMSRYINGESVKRVVFDSSFAKARPKCTMAWFADMSTITEIEGLQYLNTSEVTFMSEMFYKCSSLKTLDVSHFNTSKVSHMGYMFDECSSLTSLDVSHFNTSEVTNMQSMFRKCSSLTGLDVSNFDTSKATTMSNLFAGCSNLTTLDVSHFDTSQTTDMYSMFWGCSGLSGIDVSNFNTSKVTNMTWMFGGCSSLNSIDISNFDISGLVDGDDENALQGMFYDCNNLKTIKCGELWNMKSTANSSDMFIGCTSLVGGQGTKYDSNHTDGEYARIDGGPNSPGYFTSVNAVTIKVEPQDIDFGTMTNGSSKTDYFIVYNTGRDNLVFHLDYSTLDGVFNVLEGGEETVLKPGESKKYTVTCTIPKDYEYYGGGVAIYVRSNASNDESIMVGVGVNVIHEEKKEIYVTPTEIDFGRVELGTDKTANFTVTNNKSTDVTFSVPYWGDYFDVSDTNEDITLAPGESKVFTITAHGMKRGSQASCEFRINVNTEEDMEMPTVKATLTGWDTKPLTLATNSISLSRGEEKEVEIVYGSLNYELTSDDPHLFTANIADHGRSGGGWYDNYSSTTCFVRIEARATAEKATIRVKDKDTGEEVALQVTIDAVD